ncbi:MAG: InlB B-repeat-containing protein [Clostridiales bacterium]|nr:InlB B-repeat-containing protein [Clostridiales bacterium]
MNTIGLHTISIINVNSKITYIPETPSRNGYEFDGWYRESNYVT